MDVESKEKKGFLPKKESATKIIKYVQRPGETCVTWLKFVAVMLAATLLMWQLVEKIISYVENPVIVTREINYLSEIPFPGLILCNKLPLRYSYVHNSPIKAVIDQYISSEETSGRIEDQERVSHFSGQANDINVKEFYLNASQPASDFIVECSWLGGERSSCSDADFELINTDYGPCYKMNLRDEDWPNMTAAGPADAFRVVLNIDTLDSYRTTAVKSTGTIIALFQHDNPTPLVQHIGYSIPAGFEAIMAIRSEYIERLSKKKKGQCDPDAKLVLFENYTTAGCLIEHKFMRVVNACECTPYNFPEYRNSDDEFNLTAHLINFLPCNIEQQYGCAEKVWNDNDANEVKNLSCLDSCESHRYSASITYASILGDQMREGVPKAKGNSIQENYRKAINAKYGTAGWNGENFVIINIYFTELLHETIVQHLTYDGWGLAADVAATIGIILGFLLSTVGEVISNCVWLSRKVRRKKGEVEDEDEEDEEEEEEEETEDEAEKQANGKAKKDRESIQMEDGNAGGDMKKRKNLGSSEM